LAGEPFRAVELCTCDPDAVAQSTKSGLGCYETGRHPGIVASSTGDKCPRMGHLSPQELGNRAFRVVGEDVGQSVGSIEVADSDRRVDDIGKAEATSWARGSPPASAPSIARVAASRPVSNSPAHAAAVFAGRCASVEPVACCGLRPFPYGGVRAWCYNLVQPCAGLSVSLGGDATEAGRNAHEDQ
jgi:hypothetical protein